MSQQIVNCERGLLQGLISATYINIASNSHQVSTQQIYTHHLRKRLNYTFHLSFVESSFVL